MLLWASSAACDWEDRPPRYDHRHRPTSNYQANSGMGHYEDVSWVCAKRLEKGRFRWPAAQDGECVVMRPEELAMLINGLDLAEARPRKNWLRGVPAA